MQELIGQLKQIYLMIDDSERRSLRSVELTPTQVGLLSTVAQHTGGISITGLAQRLLCTRGNATRLVQRLAEQGLVSCATHKTDQRVLLVRLTAKGRRRLVKAEAALAGNATRLSDELAPGRPEELSELCSELAAALQRRLATD